MQAKRSAFITPSGATRTIDLIKVSRACGTPRHPHIFVGAYILSCELIGQISIDIPHHSVPLTLTTISDDDIPAEGCLVFHLHLTVIRSLHYVWCAWHWRAICLSSPLRSCAPCPVLSSLSSMQPRSSAPFVGSQPPRGLVAPFPFKLEFTDSKRDVRYLVVGIG